MGDLWQIFGQGSLNDPFLGGQRWCCLKSSLVQTWNHHTTLFIFVCSGAVREKPLSSRDSLHRNKRNHGKAKQSKLSESNQC